MAHLELFYQCMRYTIGYIIARAAGKYIHATETIIAYTLKYAIPAKLVIYAVDSTVVKRILFITRLLPFW